MTNRQKTNKTDGNSVSRPLNKRAKNSNTKKRKHAGRGTKKPSSLENRDGFEVKLLLRTNLVTENDQISVNLRGLIRRGMNTVRERELAARQLSKGVKFANLAGLLEALGHSQRIRILIKLLGGDATHKLLSKETGLQAGPLYHHIRELRSTGLIGPKVRDLYMLTGKGRRAIMTALAMGLACK